MQLFIDTWDKVQVKCDEQHVKENPSNSAKNCLTLGIWVYAGHDLQVLFQNNVYVLICFIISESKTSHDKILNRVANISSTSRVPWIENLMDIHICIFKHISITGFHSKKVRLSSIASSIFIAFYTVRHCIRICVIVFNRSSIF